MIYTASLNIPVKKALGNNVMQSNINKICDQLTLDPDSTNMDVVILGPRDTSGPKTAKLQKALDNCHPDICVIYLYEKAAEADLLNCQYKMQCKKVRPQDVNAAFEEFVGPHKVRRGKQQVTSADFEVFEDAANVGINVPAGMNRPNDIPNQAPVKPLYTEPVQAESNADDFVIGEINEAVTNPVEQNFTPEVPKPNVPLEDLTASQPLPATPLESAPEPGPAYVPPVDPVTAPKTESVGKVEDYLASLKNYEDWGIMKEHLNHDSLVKNLINENSEYVGLINILDVLDKRIEAVWRDSALSSEQKFEKIKDIGLERAVVRSRTNSIHVEKAISIISTIVLSAKRTVDDKVASLDTALYKISTDKAAITDTTAIDRAIEERTKVQLELLNISRSIVDLYKSVDSVVHDEIRRLDEQLPSSNQFINEMVKPIGTQIFTPTNTAALTKRLMVALQENNIVASQLEESINAVIDTLFELCEKDEEIIRYQQNMLNLLKANRVEDVVITDTLLKKVLRLFVAADNTGRSATAITWAGILSRRHNCLLIDLTGRAKFRDYGITPMRLDDFMSSRPEQPFLCVESSGPLAPDELQELVSNIKSKLNYYPYVNIILAPEDENGLQQLAEESNTIHYITDCSTTSINVMQKVAGVKITDNIARKLITIDTPVSPLMIADSIGVDPTLVKLVTLPNVPALRACALKHDRPYEYNDIVKIFEEAFR